DGLQGERDEILTQYRKKRISERDLDRQFDQIQQEETVLLEKRQRLTQALSDATDSEQRMQNARTLLQQLHARLDDAGAAGMTPALKHEIVTALVREIRVDTVDIGLSQRGNMKRRAVVHAYYVFDEPADQREQMCDVLQSPCG
ncbi:MAG: hypothetical protein ACXWQR_23720, partial [Ktedonobacterales bacterium]